MTRGGERSDAVCAVVDECSVAAVSDGVGDANILFIGGAARVCAAFARLRAV